MDLSFLSIGWGISLDYGWFLAAVCWAGVLVGAGSRRHFGPSAPWLAAFAATNCLLCVMELLADLSWAWLVRSQQGERWTQRVTWDFAIGAALPLAAVFLFLAGSRWRVNDAGKNRTSILVLLGVGLIGACAVAIWRFQQPVLAGAIGFLWAVGVAGWIWRAKIFRGLGLGASGDAAVAWWALLLVVSTTGPLAYALGQGRKNYDIAPFGFAAQFVALAAGAMLAFGVWRKCLGAEQASPAWRYFRNSLRLIAVWFVVGYVILLWSSSNLREDYETTLLQRARTIGLFLDQAAMRDALGPELQLTALQRKTRYPAGELVYCTVGDMKSRAWPVLRSALQAAVDANPDIWSINLMAARAGWLALVIVCPCDPVYYPEIYLEKPGAKWEAGVRESPAGFVLPPAVYGWGNVVRAIVPVGEPGKPAVGWLDVEVFTTKWADTFSFARMEAMGVLLAGVLLWSAGLRLRLRQAEQERLQAQAAAASEADRAKGVLLANVSHELRTPLQSILGYGDLLQREVATEEGRARLELLRRQSRLMLRLVNDLLDLSAMESGEFRMVEHPTALATLVRETVADLRLPAEAKGLEISCEIAPDFPPWLLIDGERFRQVVLNLAGNALKFTERGRIDVGLRVAGWETDGACVIDLTVRDTGPGIAAKDQVRLFQAFARLELTANKEGTGLGLALSSALCRSHGGNLTVESDGRTGACFRARLKLRPAAPPAAAAPAVFPTLRGRRVLIVDDNPLVRDLFAAWLTELGATCETADDGEQALRRAAEQTFDAVVLDLAMPRLDGLAATRRLRSLGRAWRIIGVSAHASGGDRAQALAAGMDAFLAKPVELQALAAALVAGPAPSIAADKHARLREELIARFRPEAPALVAAIREALARRDWPSVRARLHYLKGGAGAIGDENLYGTCTAVEDAAEEGDEMAAAQAWTKCEAALGPWLT